MLAEAIRDGLRSYGQQLPELDGTSVDAWLLDLLTAAHRLNAHNGRAYWELSALEPELTGELAAAAAERRLARRRFAERVTDRLWHARAVRAVPPSGWSTPSPCTCPASPPQSLAGDFERTADEVARSPSESSWPRSTQPGATPTDIRSPPDATVPFQRWPEPRPRPLPNRQ